MKRRKEVVLKVTAGNKLTKGDPFYATRVPFTRKQHALWQGSQILKKPILFLLR